MKALEKLYLNISKSNISKIRLFTLADTLIKWDSKESNLGT